MGFIDILLYFISNTSYEDVSLNYMGFIDLLLYFISNTSYEDVSLNHMGFIDVLLHSIWNTRNCNSWLEMKVLGSMLSSFVAL